MEEVKDFELLQARLQDIIMRLRTAMQADAVTMVFYDHETSRFYLPFSIGLLDSASFASVMPTPDRLTGKIIREKRRLIANSVRGHPEIDGPFARREKITSAAGLPILADDQAIGVVFVNYRRPHQFTEHDLNSIESFTQEAAHQLIVGNVMSWFRENTYHIQSEEQQVLQNVAQTIYTVMNRMPVAIWLRDRDLKRVSIHAGLGVIVDYQKKAVAHLDDDSIISHVIRTGESVTIKHVSNDSRFKYRGWALKGGWESLLVVPLKVKNHVRGAIEVFSLNPRDFSQTDVNNISAIIEGIGLAIENYQRAQELKVFSQIVQTLGTILEPEKALQEIVDGARVLANADTAAIFFFTREKDGENFRLASQSPRPNEHFAHIPRPIGGISRYIIDTGRSVSIADVLEDNRVHQEVIEAGARSLIGVPVQVGLEKSAVLYVTSKQPYTFGDHDVDLLRDLAKHAAAALQRVQLLDALKRIERAGSRIFEVDNVTQELLRETCRLGFDFGAVQLIDHATGTIATVQGLGIARDWDGLAKHRLNGEARDIQADIAEKLTIEIISGWDPRFDRWIYHQFNHQQLIRIFAPIFLLRDEKGNLYPPTLDCYDWENPEEFQSHEGARLRLRPNRKLHARKKHYLEVVGTIEAGYVMSHSNCIRLEEAQNLFRLICSHAYDLWETQLSNVLETIVKNAMHLIAADSASIRLLYDPVKERYVFSTCTGKLVPEYMEIYRSRKDGIGAQALRDRVPKVSDKNFQKEYPEYFHLAELKKLYPERYKPDEGIRAFACFPLIVSETQYGLLFLHFWREHRFSHEELEWGKLFAEQAVTALKNTLVYQEKRKAARALDSLHFVGQFLVSQPQVKVEELLQRIGQSALNVLDADIITAYPYNQQTDDFPILPPSVEGELFAETKIKGEVERGDAPSRIVRDIRKNIYAPDVLQHDIFYDRDRVRSPGKEIPYVVREKIKSAAGILLRVGVEIVGVMFVNYRTRREFSSEERRLIETFASSAAIGIYNARLFNKTDEQLRNRLEELTVRIEELQQLQEVSKAITYFTTDVKDVLQQIARGARRVLNADVTLILPYDAATTTFNRKLVGYDGVQHDLPFDAVQPGGVATAVLKSADGFIIVEDISQPPIHINIRANEGILGQINIQSFLGVALRVSAEVVAEGSDDKETVGVLFIDFLQSHKFKKEEVEVAQMFANYAATAIAAARIHERRLEFERVTTINAFGARFAHRVGNLLGTIPLNFNAIQRLLKEVDNASLQAHLKLLSDDVRKVERILDAGKVLRRFGAINKEPVMINRLVLELTKQLKIQDNIIVSLELDSDVETIAANELVVVDILTDIIDNALDAMSAGGRLTLGTKRHQENSSIEIYVRDTGHGIAPDILQSLQKPVPFFSTKKNNLGLGVWLDYQAVQQMGGRLNIESQVNLGTTFSILLPHKYYGN